MKIGPYTVSRGAMVPYRVESETEQDVVLMADGSVTVSEQAFNDATFIRAKIKVPPAEATLIATFIREGVHYRRIPFTIQDPFGQSFVVRYWDRRVRAEYRGTLAEMDLLFRKEITG